ncbi:unnamed protein product [Vitrella brassicaformis CCMP3155]|uniref:Arsenical-resistance protein n=2 Tax=Vitrella brassicaformis TaxID=1169539 RepID=A0A0G4EFP3_VITBC|nr:unnamed protein product [Vitrella brassicaformis CCMP3155]|mmetsp:Transcript_22904/g.56579  ORF Transcript_22904/g.56579 Transcript_22904/m.56579 type:complete len:395 (+) Transcript_22904:144-1328(+)|eukprot:CEL94557.1 unnamed protein product [Vitrella brassicaformis CCMP3155]
MGQQRSVVRQLGLLDQLLPILVLVAMAGGILLGYYNTGIRVLWDQGEIEGVSIPIAVGLLVMMYPVLCKVRYEKLPEIFRYKGFLQQLLLSLVLNWIIGPALMTALAWATLPDLPAFRVGIIMVGLARCIAMVLIWNMLASGHSEFCAVLVAVNSVLQIFLYSPFAYIYIELLGGSDDVVNVSLVMILKSVAIFLGIPVVAGFLTRLIIRGMCGLRDWYDNKLMPVMGPLALVGLLFTIVVMFAAQGERVIDEIGNVCRVAVPLILYFGITFVSTFLIVKAIGMTYEVTVTQAFTTSSNNFELAIAVAVSTYGIDSQQALATTIGPLIEVPMLLGLVYVALWAQRFFVPGLKGLEHTDASEAEEMGDTKASRSNKVALEDVDADTATNTEAVKV